VKLLCCDDRQTWPRLIPIVAAFTVGLGASPLALSAPLALSTRFAAATPAGMLSGGTVARAVMKYFGKEGTEEATEFLARQGGRELAERVATAAAREGGEEAADQVSRLAAAYGPDALRALDNAPELAPVLAALKQLPESEIPAVLSRLSAGASGRELARSIGRVGVSAVRGDLVHPGVGAVLARSLGDEGTELATKLSTDQAITVARHADDLAVLPAGQRQAVLALLHRDAERMVAFMGRFAADNPGKTLFTAAATTVLLAESERILGGDEIVFDAEGNPVVVSKAGFAGRTLQAGGKVAAELSESYLRPLYLTGLAFITTFASLFLLLKLGQTFRRGGHPVDPPLAD
jgi:hypothetical protein